MDLVTYFVVKTAVKALVKAATESDCPDVSGCPDVSDAADAAKASADAGGDLVGIVLDALT